LAKQTFKESAVTVVVLVVESVVDIPGKHSLYTGVEALLLFVVKLLWHLHRDFLWRFFYCFATFSSRLVKLSLLLFYNEIKMYIILDEIAYCSASDSAFCYIFIRSVVCLFVVCLSHSCTHLD